jgi:hypothetical protein
MNATKGLRRRDAFAACFAATLAARCGGRWEASNLTTMKRRRGTLEALTKINSNEIEMNLKIIY